MNTDKNRGLYGKYSVQRTDGQDQPNCKHHLCSLFVLDVTHDKHAIPAIRAYIDSCRKEYPELAIDLMQLLHKYALDEKSEELKDAREELCLVQHDLANAKSLAQRQSQRITELESGEELSE